MTSKQRPCTCPIGDRPTVCQHRYAIRDCHVAYQDSLSSNLLSNLHVWVRHFEQGTGIRSSATRERLLADIREAIKALETQSDETNGVRTVAQTLQERDHLHSLYIREKTKANAFGAALEWIAGLANHQPPSGLTSDHLVGYWQGRAETICLEAQIALNNLPEETTSTQSMKLFDVLEKEVGTPVAYRIIEALCAAGLQVTESSSVEPKVL